MPRPVWCSSIAVIVVALAASAGCPGRSTKFTLAKPKSSILACPRLVVKMFAGLMSRWMMPCSCGFQAAGYLDRNVQSGRICQSGRSFGEMFTQRLTVQ